ncbi:MAG: hypothetical protein DCC71_09365 [Proteobacteria bacterium]|nr:MAG: hypothetical protein DCC71_09365 [Pseudomonadota bacterium]
MVGDARTKVLQFRRQSLVEAGESSSLRVDVEQQVVASSLLVSKRLIFHQLAKNLSLASTCFARNEYDLREPRWTIINEKGGNQFDSRLRRSDAID